MKHEFVDNVYNFQETSVLCNEEHFPTYPRSTIAGEHVNWTFNGHTERRIHFEETDQKIYDELPPPSRSQNNNSSSLTLDIVPNDVQHNTNNNNNNYNNYTFVSKSTTKNTITDEMSSSQISNSNNNNNNNNNSNNPPNVIIGKTNTSSSSSSSASPSSSSKSGFHIALYGWRKKCLYILILGLIILIIVNLALTLWILKVMEFSSDGMGQLKIVAGGLQLSGQTMVLDILRASVIRSRHGQPIILESSRNFSINTRDWQGNIENNLFLGHDKLEILAHGLKIIDTQGVVIFSADKNEITIGANALRIDGEGGAIFRESVQTPFIRSEAGRELRFESATRSIQMNAGQDIFLKSAAGSIDATCLNDLRFHSEAGNIRLDSANVLMPNLKTAQPPIPGMGQSHDRIHKVYQLCACSNGKLFLAMSHSICAGDESIVCR